MNEEKLRKCEILLTDIRKIKNQLSELQRIIGNGKYLGIVRILDIDVDVDIAVRVVSGMYDNLTDVLKEKEEQFKLM